MKILLLLANSNGNLFKQCTDHIKQVLEELDVEIDTVDLMRLPYFQGKREVEVEKLVQKLEQCKGVIACSNIHIGGMHGAMQTFFDHMILYSNQIKSQPMFVMTYSDWMGEIKGANDILGNWHTLGGSDGGKICLNEQLSFETVEVSLERSIEAFYRMIKQERPEIISNERRMFIENFKVEKVNEPVQYVNLSTEEQNIQELTALLKGQLHKKDENEFIQYNTAVYQKPQVDTNRVTNKKIQSLPHYFIAKHDLELDLSIQFTITDTGEEGTLYIQNGDCEYRAGKIEQATIEIAVTDKVLSSILSKEMSYQKAFMLGRIKVRGNFVYLSKIDQVFKAM